jgi:hypothetical protein
MYGALGKQRSALRTDAFEVQHFRRELGRHCRFILYHGLADTCSGQGQVDIQ